jgi:hypothetical protein
MPIRQILFPILLSFRYVGIRRKHNKNKIAFSPEEIEIEISRRLDLARNNNSTLFSFYWSMLQNHHP